MPEIIHTSEQRLSHWVTLVSRSVKSEGSSDLQVFHSLQLADYVNILAVTEEGRIPLVRQFRPALKKYTLEFPGGLLEKGEDPERTASRELFEETGYIVRGSVSLLGRLSPDTGRLGNALWCYFAESIVPSKNNDWIPEPTLETLFVSKSELRELIASGQFDHALNIAALGLAVIGGKFSFRDDPVVQTISE
jgi:ADP-ribose pyrophosphatase